MDVVDIISLGSSLLAIILTITMYYKHDKRLKEQEAKLNAYQIKKIEDEESDSKKAQIRGNIIKGEKGKRTLRIYNSGRAKAENIRIEFPDDVFNRFAFMPYPSPYEFMNWQDNFDIIFYPSGWKSTDTLKVKFVWDDSSGCNIEFVQPFTL